MNLKYYFRKVYDVRLRDVFSFFPMVAGWIGSIFLREKYQNTWAVSERKDEAQDNGYHFFCFLRREHPEQQCIYVIDKHCEAYRKVETLGTIIQYGSVLHWVLYFSCPYLISPQSFKPNGYMATLLERMGLVKPNHVFLQHGITINMPEYLFASHRIARYFIAGAKPEYVFLREHFGYPDGTIQYTGFARFDALHDFTVRKNQILIMPTWRKWLHHKSERQDNIVSDLSTSEYVRKWTAILKSEALDQLICKYNLEVIFYPHPNLKSTLNVSSMVGERVRIADHRKEDLQELLRTSEMLITDYSSVFFDMVYMKKPIIFFQFDEEEFRKYHYKEGWFDYHTTVFGTLCLDTDGVLDALKELVQNDYAINEDYLAAHHEVFSLYDHENCHRIYELLRNDPVVKK